MRRPPSWPRAARLPELKDRRAGVGGAGVGGWGVSGAGVVSGANQPGRMVRQPPDEGVIGVRIAELGEDALAQSDQGVSVR